MCRYLQANIVFPLLDDSLVNLILPQSSNQQYKAKGPQRTTNDPPYQASITPVTCHQAAERGGTLRAHPARHGQTAQAHQARATEVSPPVKNVESNRRKTEKTNSLFFFVITSIIVTGVKWWVQSNPQGDARSHQESSTTLQSANHTTACLFKKSSRGKYRLLLLPPQELGGLQVAAVNYNEEAM